MIFDSNFVNLFLKEDKYKYQKQEAELQRKLKSKKEITIDDAYNWWKWILRFAKVNSRNKCPYIVETKVSYDEFPIQTFRNFCEYLTKYKNVRIV